MPARNATIAAGTETRDADERLLWMGEPTIIKATGRETSGRYTLIEILATPAGLVPRHVHHREDEAFYVLEGAVTFQIGDQAVEGVPGTSSSARRTSRTATRSRPRARGC